MPLVFSSYLVLTMAGCGGGAPEGPNRVALEGAATFDGNPIQAGQITFIPDSSKGNSGPASSASIRNGRYTTANGGKGVVGGPHRVRVIGFDGNAKPEEELPDGLPLFSEYEMQLDLPKPDGQTGPATVDVAVPKEAAKPAGKKQRQPSV